MVDEPVEAPKYESNLLGGVFSLRLISLGLKSPFRRSLMSQRSMYRFKKRIHLGNEARIRRAQAFTGAVRTIVGAKED
jgi:hypothetical protein